MVSAPIRQPFIATLIIWVFWLIAIAIYPDFVETEDRGNFYTRQTARVAVAYWGIAIALMLLDRSRWLISAIWTLAWLAFVIHVAIAFKWVHGWSHSKAFTHVEEVSGYGPGVFVSYAFTAIWGVDVVRRWLTDRDSRDGVSVAILHSFMSFIIFCGTVVYEQGFIRWAGLLMFAVLLLLITRKYVKIDSRQ